MSGNSSNNNNSKDWIKVILKDEKNPEIINFDMHIKGKVNNWEEIKKEAIAQLKTFKYIKEELK